MDNGQKRVVVVRSDSGTRDSRLQKELRMFVEAGFETTLLCWDREGRHKKHETKEGYTVHRCHLKAPYASRRLFLLTPVWWAYEFLHLLTHKAHCIHACDFDTVVPALLVKLLKRTPVVYDIYDFYSVKSRTVPAFLKGLFRRAEQLCACAADGVIIVDASREYLLGKNPPERLVVAMNCPYDAVDPSWKKNESRQFTIFYGGLIAPYRGIRKLARVTAELDNVKVVIAGWITDDSYRKLFDESPQLEYIGMVDYQEALRHTYRADAVYSYYDPELEINRTANSSKMFDAFMCSTAVLANSEPPAAQVIKEHECGACLPYDDEDELRNTIAVWRDRRDVPRQLGEHGRQLFEEKLDWRIMSSKILRIYSEIGVF